MVLQQLLAASSRCMSGVFSETGAAGTLTKRVCGDHQVPQQDAAHSRQAHAGATRSVRRASATRHTEQRLLPTTGVPNLVHVMSEGSVPDRA